VHQIILGTNADFGGGAGEVSARVDTYRYEWLELAGENKRTHTKTKKKFGNDLFLMETLPD
jgi:hypothetical protein